MDHVNLLGFCVPMTRLTMLKQQTEIRIGARTVLSDGLSYCMEIRMAVSCRGA